MSLVFRCAAKLTVLLGMAAVATSVHAVLLSSDTEQRSTRAPDSEVPWLHVGRNGNYSAVYLGNRWVLTAAHVGALQVEFGGLAFSPVPSSTHAIRNGDGTPSDLLAFRIGRDPGLPLLPIARMRPVVSSELLLAGNGRDRGPPVEWTDPDGTARGGWQAADSHRLRWGTNRLDGAPVEVTVRGVRTRVLAMTFTSPQTPGATQREAQAVVGDSGGALFARQQGGYELVGILILRSGYDGQPTGTTTFGNRSYAADLSVYRAQLIALTRPDCADERDNDDDGSVDFPEDPDCRDLADDSEAR